MEGIINLPLFLVTALLIIIAPGPDFIYVTTRGIAGGNKVGVMSALGISAGLLVHTLFAVFGLSAIIQASTMAFLIIKFLGAGYLVFLGVKSILSKSKIENFTSGKSNKNGNIFKQGVITNVFNPKAIVTFMAFLPQFVDVNNARPTIEFTEMGLILSVMAVVWFGIVGYFAGLFGMFVKKYQVAQNVIRYLSGSIMISLGLRLAVNEQ
jgi:threonine/homoserine/homoserine lactone efflux protein